MPQQQTLHHSFRFLVATLLLFVTHYTSKTLVTLIEVYKSNQKVSFKREKFLLEVVKLTCWKTVIEFLCEIKNLM